MASMDGGLWKFGPKPGCFYDFPVNNTSYGNNTKSRTLAPSVTGTSVLGLKYKDGVIIAGDILGSYGSLARYRNLSRLMKVNEKTILGAGGDYADYQHLRKIIQERVTYEDCLNDGFGYTPKALFSYLTRLMYYRRTQFNPLWNVCIVGGINDDETPFLGYVDKIGVAYEADTVASGYGAYIALPLLRDEQEKNPNMSEKEARELIDKCIKVLYYRDARSFDKYEVAICTKDGSKVEGPLTVDSNWEVAKLISGYE